MNFLKLFVVFAIVGCTSTAFLGIGGSGDGDGSGEGSGEGSGGGSGGGSVGGSASLDIHLDIEIPGNAIATTFFAALNTNCKLINAVFVQLETNAVVIASEAYKKLYAAFEAIIEIVAKIVVSSIESVKEAIASIKAQLDIALAAGEELVTELVSKGELIASAAVKGIVTYIQIIIKAIALVTFGSDDNSGLAIVIPGNEAATAFFKNFSLSYKEITSVIVEIQSVTVVSSSEYFVSLKTEIEKSVTIIKAIDVTSSESVTSGLAQITEVISTSITYATNLVQSLTSEGETSSSEKVQLIVSQLQIDFESVKIVTSGGGGGDGWNVTIPGNEQETVFFSSFSLVYVQIIQTISSVTSDTTVTSSQYYASFTASFKSIKTIIEQIDTSSSESVKASFTKIEVAITATISYTESIIQYLNSQTDTKSIEIFQSIEVKLKLVLQQVQVFTGGSSTGGPVTGGPVTGGPVTGGPVTGGPVTGGPVTGGSVTGVTSSGGLDLNISWSVTISAFFKLLSEGVEKIIIVITSFKSNVVVASSEYYVSLTTYIQSITTIVSSIETSSKDSVNSGLVKIQEALKGALSAANSLVDYLRSRFQLLLVVAVQSIVLELQIIINAIGVIIVPPTQPTPNTNLPVITIPGNETQTTFFKNLSLTYTQVVEILISLKSNTVVTSSKEYETLVQTVEIIFTLVAKIDVTSTTSVIAGITSIQEYIAVAVSVAINLTKTLESKGETELSKTVQTIVVQLQVVIQWILVITGENRAISPITTIPTTTPTTTRTTTPTTTRTTTPTTTTPTTTRTTTTPATTPTPSINITIPNNEIATGFFGFLSVNIISIVEIIRKIEDNRVVKSSSEITVIKQSLSVIIQTVLSIRVDNTDSVENGYSTIHTQLERIFQATFSLAILLLNENEIQVSYQVQSVVLSSVTILRSLSVVYVAQSTVVSIRTDNSAINNAVTVFAQKVISVSSVLNYVLNILSKHDDLSNDKNFVSLNTSISDIVKLLASGSVTTQTQLRILIARVYTLSISAYNSGNSLLLTLVEAQKAEILLKVGAINDIINTWIGSLQVLVSILGKVCACGGIIFG